MTLVRPLNLSCVKRFAYAYRSEAKTEDEDVLWAACDNKNDNEPEVNAN